MFPLASICHFDLESGILGTVVDSLPPVCERVCVRRLRGPGITDRTQ